MRPFALIILLLAAVTQAVRIEAAVPQEIDRYYLVTISGRPVGYDHFQRVRTPSGTYRSIADSYVKMDLVAPSQEVSVRAVGEFGRDGKTPLSYALTMVRNGVKTNLHCRFQGRTAIWDSRTGDRSNHGDIKLPAGTVTIIDNMSWMDLVRKAAGHGRSRIMTFSPYLGQLRDVTVWRRGVHTETVGGKPVRCLLWETTMPSIIAPVAISLSTRQDGTDVVALRAPIMKLEYTLADREAVKDFIDATAPEPPDAAPSVAK